MKPLPKGEAGFAKMWRAHPHNYQDDVTQDTSSDALRAQHGLPDYITNTCAVRMSIMLNGIGETLLPANTASAGVARRPHYRPTTRLYYLLAAQEMWTYLANYYRRPDVVLPAKGVLSNEAAFEAAFAPLRPQLAQRKGIVAFEKIFSYQGTGHVDLFDGTKLSDARTWYPCQRLRVWWIV